MDKQFFVDQLRKLAVQYDLKISDDVLGQVIGISKFKVYSKNEVMARIGDDASYAGIVVSGLARSYYIDRNGNDITQFFAVEGCACIDSGMFGFTEMTAMWEALEDSTVMLFEVSKIKELIMGNDELKDLWISLLEGGMQYKIYRENGFLVENATERYLSFRKRSPHLAGRVPQQYIATYLGITPESLSRIRKACKESSRDN